MRGDILVVDDEAGPRESLRMILKRDHTVRTASSGKDALTEIERERPDLVLLDLHLGDMDGTEVLTWVKERYPEVEVAIITAYAAVESARVAVRYGAVEYLTKPYSRADVERIVESALQSRRREQDAALLAAQLARMSEALTGRVRSLDDQSQAGLADALQGIQQVKQTLGDELDSVSRLGEFGELAASVTHDINNLLTVILTSAEGLLMQLDAPRDTDSGTLTPQVARIARAAEDCSAMIRQVKEFARLNSTFNPRPISVKDVVATVLDMQRGVPGPTGRKVDFQADLQDTPPVMGDEVGLRTVLMNLVENAKDAIDETGAIRLSTSSEGDRVRVQVADDGCGMSEEVLARATQAFYTANKPSGTGLGLSIVERMVKRHGGTVSIQSQAGCGTTVTVELPAVVEQEQPQEEAPPGGRAPVVVIAEDNAAMLGLLTGCMEAEGYEVQQAADGDQAWDICRRLLNQADARPMLLLTDHEMPGMLGRDLAGRVKSLAPATPVILVTGYLSPDDPGPEDALIGKPFDLPDLLSQVRALLGKPATP